MSMEPTKEQLRAIAESLQEAGLLSHLNEAVAQAAFAVIAPMVCEAAAKACEARAIRLAAQSIEGELQAQVCRDDAAVIRALPLLDRLAEEMRETAPKGVGWLTADEFVVPSSAPAIRESLDIHEAKKGKP